MIMAEQQLLITEKNYITPLEEILNNASPETHPNPQENSKSIKDSLDTLFPEQQYEQKRIQKAKEILGTLATEFTETQLNDAITEVQFLTDCWLDEFERKVFGGLTLQELLHEKGGL